MKTTNRLNRILATLALGALGVLGLNSARATALTRNKSFLNSILGAALLAGGLVLCAVPVRAAGITWRAPVTISADTDVSTSGTLVSAVAVNGGSAVTINGVTFETGTGSFTIASTPGALSTYGAFGTANAPYSDLSADYQALLTTADYNAGASTITVTMNGLTTGNTYVVQIWGDDSRANATYTSTVTSTGGNSVTMIYGTAAAGGVGRYIIGTFVADATTQAFTISGSSVINVLNAIQLRDQGVVAATPTDYWNGNVNGTWDTSTLNWMTNAAFTGSAQAYANGNYVVFNDYATGTTTVSNTVTVSPGSITANLTNKSYTIGGNGISGSPSLTKNGTNTLTLTATNTLGLITINGGTLTIGGAGQLNSDVNITDNGALNFNSSVEQTISGIISGIGPVSIGSGSALALSGSISSSTNVTVASGATLNIPNTAYNALPNGAGKTWNVAGTINVTGSAAVEAMANTVNLTGGTLASTTSGGATFGSYFANGTTITANGTGNVISAVDVSMNNGTVLTLNTPLAGDTLTASTIFKNTTGTSGLTKTGSGTVTLSGANTYTSATTVSNGTLLVNSPGSLAAASAVAVNAGGTLGGNGVIGGAVTVNSGGGLAPGTNSTDIDTLTINGALTLNAGSTNLMRIDKQAGPVLTSSLLTGMAGVTYGGTLKVTATGASLAPGDTFTLFTLGSGGYGSVFSSYDLPALPAGLSWDTSQLAVNGSITVANTAAVPSFNPPGGGYVGAQTVTISSLTPGATIYYTTDGSTPTTSSAHGTTPITGVSVPVPTNMTLKAYAAATGFANSAVQSATYATVVTPIWANPAGGTWSTVGNWSNNAVGNGSGVTADFSTLTLTGDATVTLDIPVTLGDLVFADRGNAYNWIVADGGGSLTLAAGANRPVITVVNTNTTIGATVAGTNGLIKAGAGELTLAVPSTYTGGTTVSNGTLKLDLTSRSTTTPLNLGAYSVGASGNLELYTTGPLGYGTCALFSGGTTITGTGTLTKTGTGWVDLWVGSSIVNFTGHIDVQEGLLANQTDWSTSAGQITVNVASGATLDARIGSIIVDQLTGLGTVLVSFTGGGPVVVGAQNGSSTFDGVMQDGASTLALVKNGGGTFTLTGANTYTGNTTVSNGTLIVSGALGVSAVTVKAGATLAGNGNLGGAATVQSGGTLAPGSNNIGTLTISGALSLNAGSTNLMRIDKAAGPVLTSSLLTGMAGVTYGGTLEVTATGATLALGDTFTLFTLGSGAYGGVFRSYDLPALPAGLSWDTSQLAVNGTIKVGNNAAAPAFNPPADTYVGAVNVTISSLTPGATIHYTTDGSDPTTSGTVHSGASPVTVSVPAATSMTIKAYVTASGYSASSVQSAAYTTVGTPTWINPAGGSWSIAGDWTNNLIANHSGWPADFSTLKLTTDATVYLDIPATVGALVFADQGNAYNWILADGGGSLTLDAGVSEPVITVINSNATISGTLAGTSGFVKTGAGTLTLSGATTYTGGTTVTNGTLQISPPSTTGAFYSGFGSPVTVISSGVLEFNSSQTYDNRWFYNQPLSGNGTVNINDGTTGNIVWSGQPGTVTLTGQINVMGGLFGGDILSSAFSANTASLDIAFGAIFDIRGNGTTHFNALTGAGTVESTYGSSAPLTVGVAGGSGTFSGTITAGGGISLIKAGSGTQVLAGPNTYTGATTVSNGTLVVNGSVSGGTGVYLAPAGTLAGIGVIGAPVVSDGTFAPGTNGIGTLTLNDALTLNAGSTTTLAIDRTSGTGTYGNVQGITSAAFGGTLTVTSLGGTFQNGDTFTLIGATTYSGNFTASNLPALGAGLKWEWNPAAGTLHVVSGSLTPPTLSGIGPAAGGFVLTFSGPSGQTYKVLGSTNVALPLTDWSVVTSGTFGATPVNYTNTPATAPHEFYRVVSP